MVRKLKLSGGKAWLKEYEKNGVLRRLLTRLWNLLARVLSLPSLIAPPPPSPSVAKAVEHRRLQELRDTGAHVPDVLGESQSGLILSHLGDTLSSQLKRARDPDAIDAMVRAVADAIACLHSKGGYLGQAFPRNIVLADGRKVGFIDFEEDPLEVMTLGEAQARDWIMFTAGVAGYYRDRPDRLSSIVRQTAIGLHHDVPRIVLEAASRLRFLESGWLRSDYAIGIQALRNGLEAA